MANDCSVSRALLGLADELDDATRSEIESHTTACADCARLAAELMDIRRRLADVAPPPAPIELLRRLERIPLQTAFRSDDIAAEIASARPQLVPSPALLRRLEAIPRRQRRRTQGVQPWLPALGLALLIQAALPAAFSTGIGTSLRPLVSEPAAVIEPLAGRARASLRSETQRLGAWADEQLETTFNRVRQRLEAALLPSQQGDPA